MATKNGILDGEFRSVLKVHGGKLLKARVKVREHVIYGIVLTGDFFMYPEEALDKLEAKLVGLEPVQEKLLPEIEKFMAKYEVVGAKAEDFVELITSAVKKKE
ncbi:MAG: lipoate protein ligase C-terminal domain-containing protein [Candidatus Thermoplasmatota archaeon]|nr:lipoate protein ligase C-terminal domain-containing protein [Candidatus Thermoplasmatota archaeon]